MITYKLTPQELIELRKRVGLSVSEAAECCKVSVRSWNRFESGERAIPKGLIELFYLKNGIKD